MELSLTGEQISWLYNGAPISVSLAHPTSAVSDEKEKRNLVVCSTDDNGYLLVGLDYSGSQLFVQGPLQGAQFGYLTLHPTDGALVVVTFDAAIDGWRDWHYAIGPKGELTRRSPAY